MDIPSLPSELSSLLKIKQFLDARFGKGNWSRWEPETLSIDLNQAFSDLMMDKFHVLRILETTPEVVLDNPALFIYATEAINNNVVDFDVLPHVTMLEAAYSVHTIKGILSANGVYFEPTEALKLTIAFSLNMDGASVAPAPLDFVPSDALSSGQTQSDSEAKKKAVEAYISHMDSL